MKDTVLDFRSYTKRGKHKHCDKCYDKSEVGVLWVPKEQALSACGLARDLSWDVTQVEEARALVYLSFLL